LSQRKLTELRQDKERVILVGVELPGRKHRGRLLAELAQLVDTAGGEVVGEIWQRRRRVEPTYFIGTGKAEEIRDLCEELKPDLVVFDNDLTGAQVRNLENLIKVHLIDRSELILDIFAMHAKTAQSKLQVELAQSEYELPRLKRMWTHLSRYEGGIGTRGPGEKQLEEDKRAIRNRIHALKRKLSRIERHREREVSSREAEFTVSLVGYTNAGKSTLLNRLTGTSVSTDNQLFVTLDTKTSLWNLGPTKVLLSDTVGFIRNIPHHLIASFHATLEEVTEADLLLHVVDASDPEAEYMVEVVKNVLEELGCSSKPTILVLNKTDSVKDSVELTILSKSEPRSVAVSAVTGEGLDKLSAMVLKEVESRWDVGVAEFPASNGKLLARLSYRGDVISRSYSDGNVKLRVKLPVREAARLGKEPGVSWKSDVTGKPIL
jgi:GTP-binding protein HflX